MSLHEVVVFTTFSTATFAAMNRINVINETVGMMQPCTTLTHIVCVNIVNHQNQVLLTSGASGTIAALQTQD